MVLRGYISDLMEVENLEVNVGGVAEELLKFFIKYPKCSTYQTHKYLEEIYKRDNRTISYKNVHKRIQKLHQFGLIKEVRITNETTTKHGAIYYSLTTFGIFYIIKNELVSYNKNLIIEYKHNSLFENFLYPFIEFNTICRLNDIKIIFMIYHYLHKCSLDILDLVMLLKDMENDVDIYLPINSKKFLDLQDKEELYGFLEYLRKRLNLDWLTEKNIKITISGNDFNIINKSENSNICLRVSQEEKKVIILSANDAKISEFFLKVHEVALGSYGWIWIISGDLSKYVDVNKEEKFSDYGPVLLHQYELCYEIIQYFNYRHLYKHLSSNEKENSKNILKKDQTFLNLLLELKDEFESYYRNFLNKEMTYL